MWLRWNSFLVGKSLWLATWKQWQSLAIQMRVFRQLPSHLIRERVFLCWLMRQLLEHWPKILIIMWCCLQGNSHRDLHWLLSYRMEKCFRKKWPIQLKSSEGRFIPWGISPSIQQRRRNRFWWIKRLLMPWPLEFQVCCASLMVRWTSIVLKILKRFFRIKVN